MTHRVGGTHKIPNKSLFKAGIELADDLLRGLGRIGIRYGVKVAVGTLLSFTLFSLWMVWEVI